MPYSLVSTVFTFFLPPLNFSPSTLCLRCVYTLSYLLIWKTPYSPSNCCSLLVLSFFSNSKLHYNPHSSSVAYFIFDNLQFFPLIPFPFPASPTLPPKCPPILPSYLYFFSIFSFPSLSLLSSVVSFLFPPPSLSRLGRFSSSYFIFSLPIIKCYFWPELHH